MRRRVLWAVIGAPLALIVIGAGATLSVPMTRHDDVRSLREKFLKAG